MSATRPPAFDERLSTQVEASRRGAHRARPRPVSAGLPVLAGVAVVLLVVGGVYIVIRGGKEAPSSSVVAAGPTASSPARAGAATAGPSDSASAPGQAPSASSTAAARVDRDVDLVVLNSVSVQGLAKQVQSDIEGDGWTVQRTDNSKNRNLVTTKIYYGKTSLRGTANALKKDLGFGAAVRDASVAPDGLVVVLGQDAQ